MGRPEGQDAWRVEAHYLEESPFPMPQMDYGREDIWTGPGKTEGSWAMWPFYEGRKTKGQVIRSLPDMRVAHPPVRLEDEAYDQPAGDSVTMVLMIVCTWATGLALYGVIALLDNFN